MGAFTSALALGLQTAGPVMQGFQASKAEEFNASLMRANAQAIRHAADIDIYRQRKRAKSLHSTQKAKYAKAGVTLEGSPMEVMIDSAAEAELDMAITDYNAKVKMAQAESAAEQYEKSAKMYKMRGIMGGLNTLLTAGGMDLLKTKETKQNYATTRDWRRKDLSYTFKVSPSDYYKGRI